MLTLHPQVSARTASGTDTLVDVGMAALLEYLWSCGCETEFSCQGGTGLLAQVGFADFESLERAMVALVAVAQRAGEIDLELRIMQLTHDPTDLRVVGGRAWSITAWPKEDWCDGSGTDRLFLYGTIWFPGQDCALLRDIFERRSPALSQPT
jgi:hypothetical protein